jgi:hypothetical protein
VPASRRRHRRASQLGPAKFGTRHGGAQDPNPPSDQARPVLKALVSSLVFGTGTLRTTSGRGGTSTWLEGFD